jgi:hypothetical protein
VKIITERDIILKVPAKWKQQYDLHFRNGNWPQDKRDIYNNLLKLDFNTCTQADVAQVIGNKSWTGLKCDECKKDVDWVLHLGDEPDYESNTVYVCKECVKKAAELL